MGFGHVSSIDDYRIGLLICEEDLCYVYIFSLKVMEWKTMASVNLVDFKFRIARPIEAVLVDDTLYWPPRVPALVDEGNHIVGLNLVDGKLKKFPLMNLLIGYGDEVRVFQMKGCLSLCCSKDGDYSSKVFDVWMLKQHSDWSSWEKKFSFHVRAGFLVRSFETGKFLVRLDSDHLMIYDPSQVAPEHYEEGTDIWQGSKEQIYSKGYLKEAWGYAESLISPFGTTVSDDNEEDD
ncbi:F-box protein CPR1-like [Spinacia oleracea]|uniref:F-box protein CPR1-like n=1 Tax=Spinacia oleracea TaxID=3562 RepID=A0A9R0J834_SPIOL|nr:F-box protein CPR1-like [Spinacia oleracea]